MTASLGMQRNPALHSLNLTEETVTNTAKSAALVNEELDQAFEAFMPSFVIYAYPLKELVEHLRWRPESLEERLSSRVPGEALTASYWWDVINQMVGQAFFDLVDNYPEEVMAWVTTAAKKHSRAWQLRELKMARYKELWDKRSAENRVEFERLKRLIRWADYLTIQWKVLLEQFSDCFRKQNAGKLTPLRRFVRRKVREHIWKSLEENKWEFDYSRLRSS